MCLALPGLLLEMRGDDPLTTVGRVSFNGIVREVSLGFLPEARIGDYVVVHAGIALSVVDAEEAARVFRELDLLGEAAS